MNDRRVRNKETAVQVVEEWANIQDMETFLTAGDRLRLIMAIALTIENLQKEREAAVVSGMDAALRAEQLHAELTEARRSMVHSCEWTTSNLSLAVERPTDWIGAIVPSVRATMPVDYCRRCGLIRLHSLELVENKTDASIPAQPEKLG